MGQGKGMITHYGLFWSERDVFWGRPNNPGKLLGREKTDLKRRGAPTAEERKRAVNYREYVGIYCLYGDGNLLYVGQAGLGNDQNLFKRLTQHRKGPMSNRWDRFSWFGRCPREPEGGIDAMVALAQLEAVSIAITNPGFNRQSGSFAGSQQVFQVPHEEAEGGMETKFSRMADQLSEMQEMIRTL